MADLIYAHCAMRATSRPTVAGRWPRMPGGGAPRALAVGQGLWVIVSMVPGRDYEEGSLATRLSDVEWLAQCGAAHHDVIARAARAHAVAPFRLLTLFRSEARVAEEAGRLRSKIERALDRVGDRREWVIRIAAVSRTPRVARARSASGTAYLMTRASARVATSAATPVARRVTRELVAELRRYADRVAPRRPADATRILYDGALLVSRTRERALTDAVRRWAPRLAPIGCRLSMTGPWPPYSFVNLDGRHRRSHDRA
jgi:hypothetical protein